jgi:hypothetical protein
MTTPSNRELSRDSTLSDHEVWLLEFPLPSSGISASDSRFAAVFFPEKSSICVLDLKHISASSKAKIVTVVPVSDAKPVFAIAHSLLAVGGAEQRLQIHDFTNPESTRVIEPQLSGPPRARIITALDFNTEGKVLAAGSRSGSVHFIDLRAPSPISNSVNSAIPFPISTIRWNKLIDSQLCTVQGDAVSVWDCRSLRSPTIQIAPGGWKSPVTHVDWIGPSELILNTTNDGLVRVSDISIDFLSWRIPSSGGVTSVPTESGHALIAFQSEPGRIELVDPFTNMSVESIEIGFPPKSIAYLEDSRSLVFSSKHGVAVRSLAKHGSSWSSKDGSSLLPSESSPRLHPVASHVTSSDQFLSDEMRAIHSTFSFIARRIRRMYLQADIEIDPETALLEIGVPDQHDRFKLKIALRAEDVGGMDKPGCSWECWWAVADEEIKLPDLQIIQSEFLSKIDLELLADLGELSELLHVVRQLKEFVQSIEKPEDEDDTQEETNTQITPFPATCGVCWSPSGDLFRFHSLKGLGPFPKHRGKLTIENFEKFNDIVSSQTSATNNSVVVHLNEFSEFLEPPTESLEFNDDSLDEEFNQRVFTDACVQKLPAAVFKNNVEDHWFAQLAPFVDFASTPGETLSLLVSACNSLLQKNQSKSIQLVRDCFSLLIELLNCPARNSCLDAVKTTIILERLSTLYEAEQTQAVAVIAAILITQKLFSRSLNAELFDAALLLIHDHAVLFQRLSCFESSRVLENIQIENMPNLPLLGEPRRVGSADPNPPCSVCGIQVRGLGQFCFKCGHGGHLSHLENLTSCPVVNCKCPCWEQPTPKLPPRVQTSSIVSAFITS